MHSPMLLAGKSLRRRNSYPSLAYYPEKKYKRDNLLFVNFDE